MSAFGQRQVGQYRAPRLPGTGDRGCRELSPSNSRHSLLSRMSSSQASQLENFLRSHTSPLSASRNQLLWSPQEVVSDGCGSLNTCQPCSPSEPLASKCKAAAISAPRRRTLSDSLDPRVLAGAPAAVGMVTARPTTETTGCGDGDTCALAAASVAGGVAGPRNCCCPGGGDIGGCWPNVPPTSHGWHSEFCCYRLIPQL